jgi:hypothetical protein
VAVSAKWYGTPIKNIFNGANPVDWDSDTIKVALCTASYTPDQDAHDFFNDVTNELAGENGYTAGGATLTGTEVSYDAATNQTRLKATNNPSWKAEGASLTARYAIIYKSTGTGSTSPLLGYVDLGASVTVPAGGKFTLELDATGVLNVTAS